MIAVTGLPPLSESETRGLARGVSVFSPVTEEDDSVESTFVEEEDKLLVVFSASTFCVDVVVVFVVFVVFVVVVVFVIVFVVVFSVSSLTHLTEKCGSCCQLVVVLLLSKDATCHWSPEFSAHTLPPLW